MDEHDWKILTILRDNAKASFTDIAEETGLSRFTVKDRIWKLFQDRVILGPTLVVNPFLVGLKRTVFFEFKTNPREPWLATLLEKNPSCDLLDGIAGEYSLFGRFRLTDDAHFGRILKAIDDVMGESYFKKYRVVNAIKVFKESNTSFDAAHTESQELDKTDLTILKILTTQQEYVNAPLPISTVELSRLLRTFGITVSQPAVFNRLSELEKRGIILKHTVNVDYQKLGLKTKFVARIKVNPNAYDDVAQGFLASLSEISDLYRTGDEYGLLAILRVKNVSEYNQFVLRLYSSKDVIDTYTTLVLEERKNSFLPFTKG